MDRGGGGAAVAATVLVAIAVVVVSIMGSAVASATDSDLKHSYVLKLDASNGYEIVVLAGSERPDGRGELGLIVSTAGAGAIYGAPATVTATRIEADLGRLGEVALDVVPSGRKKGLRSSCPGENVETMKFEPRLFRGIFEFHGEEGYTEASSTAPREYASFFRYLVCGDDVGGEGSGPGAPGARLRLRAHRGSFRLTLQANKNRPEARTRIEVETREEHGRISISRSRTVRVGASAFGYDPLLRSATLAPPPPFAGQASFHRGAPAANRWSGNLTVDLPGRSDVPLTGGGVGATLVHSCLQGGEGGFRCNRYFSHAWHGVNRP
jgi:hypothetical protein